MINEIFSFYEAQEVILKFEKILESENIYVRKNSDLETKFLSIFDILFKYESKLHPEQIKNFDLFRDLSGLYDLALKIIMVSKHPDFKKLKHHLAKLNECNIAQNQESAIIDQDANKIIELYIAALCMNICETVELDHPINSNGNNPDILASYGGEIWGFACKTIHSKNSQTIFENIKKAVDQIEKSKAVIGIPVINLKNIINHHAIWPSNKAYESIKIPIEMLFNDIALIKNNLIHDIRSTELEEVFKNKKSISSVMFIAHSTTLVFRNESHNNPVPARLNMMNLLEIPSNNLNYKPKSIEFLEKINCYMQKTHIS